MAAVVDTDRLQPLLEFRVVAAGSPFHHLCERFSGRVDDRHGVLGKIRHHSVRIGASIQLQRVRDTVARISKTLVNS